MPQTSVQTGTTQELIKRAQEPDGLFAGMLVKLAERRGCDTEAEGPSFKVERAAEFLGRQGITAHIVCIQFS